MEFDKITKIARTGLIISLLLLMDFYLLLIISIFVIFSTAFGEMSISSSQADYRLLIALLGKNQFFLFSISLFILIFLFFKHILGNKKKNLILLSQLILFSLTAIILVIGSLNITIAELKEFKQLFDEVKHPSATNYEFKIKNGGELSIDRRIKFIVNESPDEVARFYRDKNYSVEYPDSRRSYFTDIKYETVGGFSYSRTGDKFITQGSIQRYGNFTIVTVSKN